SDSLVALAWLRQHPARWQTFVANRVSEIQSNLPEALWNHVSSHDNPADCASRDLSAEELSSHRLWWADPTWLAESSTYWPLKESSLSLNHDICQPASEEARAPIVLHKNWLLRGVLTRFSVLGNGSCHQCSEASTKYGDIVINYEKFK
ncbi:hypothetical protein ALC57_18050, partial [Trachymyrmex cornetzi]